VDRQDQCSAPLLSLPGGSAFSASTFLYIRFRRTLPDPQVSTPWSSEWPACI